MLIFISIIENPTKPTKVSNRKQTIQKEKEMQEKND